MEERAPEAGLAERILREVLDTPALKELALIQLKGIRPESAAGLARALLWGDPALSMSLVGALPRAVNWLSEFLLELGRQLDSLPEPLLADLARAAASGIDAERLRLLARTYLSLAGKALAISGKGPGELARLLGSSVNRFAVSLERAASRVEARREEASAFLRALKENVDSRLLASSLRHLLSATASLRRDLKPRPFSEKAAKGKRFLVIALIAFLLISLKIFGKGHRSSNEN